MKKDRENVRDGQKLKRLKNSMPYVILVWILLLTIHDIVGTIGGT